MKVQTQDYVGEVIQTIKGPRVAVVKRRFAVGYLVMPLEPFIDGKYNRLLSHVPTEQFNQIKFFAACNNAA